MLFPSLTNRGGFFSDYYLGTVFARSGGRRKSLVTKEVEAAFRTLTRLHERAEQRANDPAALREAYTRPVLRDVLGYHLGEGNERVHPLYASAEDEAAGRAPLLLAYVGGFDDDLDAKRDGKAPPSQRLATELAKAAAELRYGLLLTGERVRLIRRKGDGPSGAYLELDLPACLELGDRDSFAAAHRLLSAHAFMPADDGALPIDATERESREHARKVSDDLKRAVFGSAETLVQALLDARRDAGDADPNLTDVRDAALTCLYRLLFIRYAEARDERLLQHAVYIESYSLDGLIRELTVRPDPPPANRTGLWVRLLALFALHRDGLPGVEGLDALPARGGALFDPSTPAGRILQEVRLDDATVARVVLDLTTTAPRRGVGRERISFQELDIEQLGAVYEGLLEFEPRVATETTIEVKVQGRTYALVPAELVRLVTEKNLKLKGPIDLVAGTEAEALHPEAATDEDIGDEEGVPEEPGEGGEEGGGDGVKKGAPALLLRRLEPGRFHFVPGPGRKGSGSFYTPLPLVQDLVRHALGPLVEGRTAAEIESLRVLDPACGSAHFLVEAMRFLGRALHRAYVLEHGGKAPPGFVGNWDADHEASDVDARAAGSEARAWCKRRVAERCIFGVDLNPTAVQLAQVSLWIESLAGDRPLTYFTHHVRCGSSILGTWLERLGEPPLPELRARQAKDGGLMQDIFATRVREAVLKAADVRRQIDEADVAITAVGADADPLAEERFKEARRREADEILAAARMLFDLRSASAFVPGSWSDWPNLCDRVGDAVELERYARSREWWVAFEHVRERERFFHWELEFPEVFLDADAGGFDAVLGNPPWDKVLPSKVEFYGRYDILIRAYSGNELDRRISELHGMDPRLADEFAAYRERTRTIAQLLRKSGDFPLSEARSQAAHEDVSKYFVDRAVRLAARAGTVGMVVPSVLYNGDACVGIRRFLLERAAIRRFYGFENRRKIFPIHAMYKFVILVIEKGRSAASFDAAFMRHDLEELHEQGPKPWFVHVTRDEVERLSPETYAFLEYRSPRDQEIVRRMYEGRPTLGGDGPGNWRADFVSWRAHTCIYNSAEDKDLWTTPDTGRLYTPESVLGRVPSDPGEAMDLMRERGFWPVFEGKHIEQFLVGIKPIRWWLAVEQAEKKYGRPPRPEPTLVFRETASNTNERTCIAAVLPPKSVASHKLSGVLTEAVDLDTAAVVLNSFAFDYALRMRTAGTNVSFTYMKPMPVPPAEVVNDLPRVPTRLGWEKGVEHITNIQELWPPLVGANLAVAQAYGLQPDDLAQILTTFPVFARKRAGYAAVLQERLKDAVTTRDSLHA